MNDYVLEALIPFRKYCKQTSHGEIFWRMSADSVISCEEMYAGCILQDQERIAHLLSQPCRQGRDGCRHTDCQYD